MAIRAPNWSPTGSHSTRVTKPAPNSLKAGAAPIASETMIPTSTTSTEAANSSVILWKKKSWRRCLRMVLRSAAAWRASASLDTCSGRSRRTAGD